MANALWISLVGMSLVFLVILLLWGMMALLVRLTSGQPDRPPAEVQLPGAVAELSRPVRPLLPGSPGEQASRKRRAAAAAVAIALARRPALLPGRRAGPGSVHASSGQLSPWQAAHRAGYLAVRANPPRKKVQR